MEKQRIWTRNFIFLILSNLLVAIAFYFLIPTLPEYLSSTLKLTNTEIGIILSIYTVSALIIRPVTGFFIDRYSRIVIYLVSLLIFALIFNIYALAFSFYAFLMLRFVHGLAWGVTTTTGATIVVDILPIKRRGEGLGYFGLSMTIAMALGPLIAIVVTGSGKGFDFLFLLSGLFCLVGFVLALFVNYSGNQKNRAGSFSFKGLFDKKTIPISLVLMVVMITYGGMLFYIKNYSTELKIQNPELFFILFAAGISVSRILAGKIFDLKGPKNISIIGLLFMIVGFLILSLIKSAMGFYSASLLIGFGSGIIFPVFQAMINNIVPAHRRGAANSTLFTFVDLGIGLGMLFTGVLADIISLSEIFFFFTALNMVALVAYYFLIDPYYRKNLTKE